jgi:ABC-type Fe3+/spermidine/putrescine transport system ATPase subunit
MTSVRFDGITKTFAEVEALRPTNLDISSGEFLTLLGPSGSGKTTLLNICAGYLAPTAGRLIVGDRDITEVPARARNMGMVFQNYALFPHMSVFENVAYGLKVRRISRHEIERRVASALAMVQLEGFGSRAIAKLSGGQQQRVALARAMVIEPDILLMDEPLGALDRALRKDVQLQIRRLHLARPRTTIYVTHDQEEALVMSDRIAVMRAGKIVQVGSGRDLYERPADAFVARFLGESNLIAGRVASIGNGRAVLDAEGLSVPIAGRAAPGLTASASALALIRPESVRLIKGGIPASVVERVYLGEITAVRLRLPNSQELWCRRFAAEVPDDEKQEIGWDETAVSILPATNPEKGRVLPC